MGDVCPAGSGGAGALERGTGARDRGGANDKAPRGTVTHGHRQRRDKENGYERIKERNAENKMEQGMQNSAGT